MHNLEDIARRQEANREPVTERRAGMGYYLFFVAFLAVCMAFGALVDRWMWG